MTDYEYLCIYNFITPTCSSCDSRDLLPLVNPHKLSSCLHSWNILFQRSLIDSSIKSQYPTRRKRLASIEDCVDASIQGLKEYIKKNKERLITVANNSIGNIIPNRKTRKQKWEEKQLVGYFKWKTNYISPKKIQTWLRKGNLKRETESLLIPAQNNTKRINYIKEKIDQTQQNSKCRLYGNKDEIINHNVSEWNKQAQKEYKTRHDWAGKVIHWELCKEIEFWPYYQIVYAQTRIIPESGRHKILSGFETQTDHLIPSRRWEHLKDRGEIWPKHSEKNNNKKNYQDEDKSPQKKKLINSQIKKPHLKRIPNKNRWEQVWINKKQRTCHVADFEILKIHRVIIKESKN